MEMPPEEPDSGTGETGQWPVAATGRKETKHDTVRAY
jgi:hypothetical protein